jgi:hypothetical protein
MKKPRQQTISLDELFNEQFGSKLHEAVNEVSLVEVAKPDEDCLVLIVVGSTIAA